MREFIAGSSSARKKEQRSLPSVTTLMETRLRGISEQIIKEEKKKLLIVDVFLPCGYYSSFIPAWFAP